MEWLFQAPIAIRLTVIAMAGAVIGGWVNWAIYCWAWSPRDISPWSPAPAGCRPRSWRDRLPILGWIGLRRDVAVHGRGFWVRPLLIELFLGAGLAALYWWEVEQVGLLRPQLAPLGVAGLSAPSWVLHATFLSHAILFVLMTVASFIDIDEKTIPDRITDPGTLLGLVLATAMPMSLLPHVSIGIAAPPIGTALTPEAGMAVMVPALGQAYVEPVTATAPNPWPEALAGAPRWQSLAIGLGCYALWLFAIAPRIWRGRRGVTVALGLIWRRVWREWLRPPLSIYWLVGLVAIPLVWFWSGDAWIGLLSGLIGLAGGGALIWSVRIVGSAVLGREAMGFGDVTLMMMIGTILGWQACVFIFFLAPIAGVLIGIAQLVVRRDDVIPFGPFLCLATVFVIVGWGNVWNWAQLPFGIPGLVPIVLGFCLVVLAVLLKLVHVIKQAIKNLFLGS
jgi:prepilin signal peptidase PulO-like enzyme (type II secretory pathway)